MTRDDLERRVGQLEGRFNSVADAARKREEDFGSVRAQAAKVEGLQEQIRELKRQLTELGRTPERPTGRAEQGDSALQPTTEALQQPGGSSREVTRSLIRDELKAALNELDINELIMTRYPNLGRRIQEVTQSLNERGVQVNMEVVLSTILEQLVRRFDIQQLYSTIVGQMTEPTASRRPRSSR